MMRICACVGDIEEVRSPHLENADLMELRLDLMGQLPDSRPPLPFIVTCHKQKTPLDRMPDQKQVQEWSSRHDALYLDLDMNEELLIDAPTFRVIRSHHDWDGTPDEKAIVDILERLNGDLDKAAFTVHGLRDLLSILQASRSWARPHVVIGMGELGQITRIRPRSLGNEFTFASLGRGTAPGQTSVQTLRELGDDGLVTGLLGSPISHSLSPRIHQAAYRDTGIGGHYILLDVPEANDLHLLPEIMHGYDVRGLNVTIPHKTSVLPLMDSIDPLAEELGAVNTIHNDAGRLRGYNSDVAGLEGAFRPHSSHLRGASALLIGNGGAARAAAAFLRDRGCHITITARDLKKGPSFAEDQGAEFVPKSSLTEHGYRVIINATPVGGLKHEGQLPIPREILQPGQLVMDMVYTPRITPLLQSAREAGGTTIPGLEMLLHQAKESFRIWTGREPDMAALREAVQ
ncbi:MAG: shikimate dehydrogenase [Candidatus Methanomethylophilaceae archaeon]|nr:shikimate dehydrogenase [Candidatus Methanomethylophilaceae archaeon]